MKVGDNAHTKRSILCSCIPSNPMWGQNWPVGLQIGRDRRRGGLLMTRWGRIKLPGGAHAARGPQASGPCSRGVIQGTLHTCKKTKIKPTSRRIAKAHIAWHVLISLKKKHREFLTSDIFNVAMSCERVSNEDHFLIHILERRSTARLDVWQWTVAKRIVEVWSCLYLCIRTCSPGSEMSCFGLFS